MMRYEEEIVRKLNCSSCLLSSNTIPELLGCLHSLLKCYFVNAYSNEIQSSEISSANQNIITSAKNTEAFTNNKTNTFSQFLLKFIYVIDSNHSLVKLNNRDPTLALSTQPNIAERSQKFSSNFHVSTEALKPQPVIKQFETSHSRQCIYEKPQRTLLGLRSLMLSTVLFALMAPTAASTFNSSLSTNVHNASVRGKLNINISVA